VGWGYGSKEVKEHTASGWLFGSDTNVEDGQTRVAIVAEPLDGEDGIEIVTREVADGFVALRAAPGFIGSQTENALVNAMVIIPFAERVEATLDEGQIGKPGAAGRPLPEFKSPEETFNFTIELRALDGAVNHTDTQRSKQVGEGFTELRTLVGDDKPRSPKLRRGSLERIYDRARRRCGETDFERHQPARKAIHDGRDPKGHPEDVELGEVGVPDMVDMIGLKDVERFYGGTGAEYRRWSQRFRRTEFIVCRRTGRRFLKMASNSGSANGNGRPENIVGNGACADVEFREEALHAVNQILQGIVVTVPGADAAK